MKLKQAIAALCSVTLFCTGSAFALGDGNPEITEDPEVSVAAVTFDGGDGTAENPYLISTEEQLCVVSDIPNKCFKLTQDIALENDWIPIGTNGEAFSGTFDGGGFTVSGMIVTDGGGFFREVTGTIKNLSVEGSVTSSEQYTGGIAGRKSGGTVENCHFSGDIVNTYTDNSASYAGYQAMAGGLIGYNRGTVTSSSTNGTVTSQGNSGGLIGYNYNADISDSHSNCTILNGMGSGGLIGYSESGTISGCCALGDVSGSSEVGGLIGYSSTAIKKCYASGNVIPVGSSGDGGGLVGKQDEYSIRMSYATGNVMSNRIEENKYTFLYGGGLIGYCARYNPTIENCYAAGEIEAATAGGILGCSGTYPKIINCFSCASLTASDKRGLIGKINYPPTVTSSYYDREVSGCTDTDYGSPKTTAGMKNQLVYDGWDFDGIWGIDENGVYNDGYPYLQWELEKKIRVTKLTLDKTTAEVREGATVTLTATAEGENAEEAPITWTSSDRTVATVDGGVVKGKKIGTAVITASSGSLTASCTVNVLDGTVRPESVTLDKSDAGIVIGETVQLTASIAPEDATNTGIIWTSSDASVAKVTSKGLVTGIAAGTAQIRATAEGNSDCYAVCDITVAAKKTPVTGIEFSGNLFGEPYEISIGKTLTLSPTISPSDATNKDVRWTSSDSDIASVANGKVTGIAEGTVTITATTVDGGFSASVTVKVTKPTVYVTGIALNAEQLTVDVKKSKQLKAEVTPLNATDRKVTFKSNNNAIATVSADGTVTGVAPGTTLIQAISDTASGKFIAFCTVTVPKPIVEVTSVKLDKGALEIVEGKTVPLKAVIKPTNATYKLITWSSSDESIATVSQDGNVTARGVGEAIISATAVNGVNVLCNVTVLSADTPAQLKVEDATVKAGKQIPITVSIASNPGISTFNFDLKYDKTKMYPVSYTKGAALENVNVITPLGSLSFKDRDSVRFLCSTADSKNMDSDGDLITVVFQTLNGIEYGDETIQIVPTAFTNQDYEAINLQQDNCTLKITDYTIGDVNNDDTVDLKDSMILGQYIAGFGVELTPQGKKAAVSIYPDENDNVETSEPSLNDFQHLFRYLSDWQVELGKK